MNPVWLIAVPLGLAFISVFTGKLSRAFLWIAAMFNVIASAVLFVGNGTESYIIGGWIPPYGINLVLNDLTRILLLSANTLFLLALVATSEEVLKKRDKMSVAFSLSLAALNGILLTGDLFNLFVFLEIAAISAYIMAASGSNRTSKFAALKYLIIGAIASSLYLLSIILIYASLGTLNMADAASKISRGIMNPDVLLVAGLFMLVGLGVETKLFPFNAWAPDVYANASGRGSTILASVFPLVMVSAFIRVIVFVINFENLNNLIMLLGVVTAVIGEILAFGQKRLKKMLAYSSIAQAGLVIMLIGLGSREAFTGSIMLLLNNGFAKLILFAVASQLILIVGSDAFEEIAGIGRKAPIYSLLFSTGALTIIGMPMFFGFRSKLYVVSSTMDRNWWIPAVILLTAAIEATYYFRWIFNFVRPTAAVETKKITAPLGLVLTGILLVVIIVVLGVVPGSDLDLFNRVGEFAYQAGKALTGGM
ncbi:complex I subunit 5 family protein [Kosmotoga pacifica]|uniref:complex I subunit 5 family protein n=1 Tax=Kosmotoga pacifica TaxID=1330330 RepID=UPI00069B9D40|nr:proton-conducting transporter membrane subunit [Kosmotoga pacifica]